MPLASGKIHQGDCVKLMQKIDSGSVDLVFADPPFNIGYEYDQYDDRQEDQKYLDWCKEWIGEIYRILKPTGTFWLAIGDEYAAELKMLAQREIGFTTRSWVIWYYTFGVNCIRGFSRSHTHLFHFVKDANDFTFNSENPMVRVLSARQLVYADSRSNLIGRLPDNTWITRPQDLPTGFLPAHDTWYYSRVAGTFKEREGFHGCQMPEQLLGRIIRISSKPNDLVFDPFTGSGTSVVVAKKLGRRWMGTELSEEYVRRIEQRLNAASVGDPLDGPSDPARSSPNSSEGRKRGRIRKGRMLPVGDENTLACIVKAYKKVGQGKSADYLLCDIGMNERFVETCKDLGLPGNAFAWNRLLLRARKTGKLPRSKREARRHSFKEMDQYSFASEIAMRIMELEYESTLDDVLCRPELALEFDQVARTFAPEQSVFDLRWAALAIRKRASKSRSLANEKGFKDWLKKKLPPAKPPEFFCSPKFEVPGVYIVENSDQKLYIGEAVDMRARIERMLESESWSNLNPQTLRIIPQVDNMHGLQAVLVERSRPLLNTHLLLQSSSGLVV